MNERVLYIDGLNLFYANYHVSSHQDQNGDPNGGFVGFLNQMRNIIYKLSPRKVVIVFDGPNAGHRRKLLFKEYKGKRAKKIRYSRVYMGEEKEDVLQVNSEQTQIRNLYEFLKLLPVSISVVPYFEADDVIAHLVTQNPQYQNIIVSSDKDYLQLLSDSVFVYQPFKKVFWEKHTIQSEYGIPKENFLFYRTICGDSSDALKGVKGISKGFLLKEFPSIQDTTYESFTEFWDAIKNIPGENKTAMKLKEGYEQSHFAYKLMSLDNTLNAKARETVDSQLTEQMTKAYSKLGLKIHVMKNKLNFDIPNFENWAGPFHFLNNNLKIIT